MVEITFKTYYTGGKCYEKAFLVNLYPNSIENFTYLENALQFASNYTEISRRVMMHCRHVRCSAHPTQGHDIKFFDDDTSIHKKHDNGRI